MKYGPVRISISPDSNKPKEKRDIVLLTNVTAGIVVFFVFIGEADERIKPGDVLLCVWVLSNKGVDTVLVWVTLHPWRNSTRQLDEEFAILKM